MIALPLLRRWLLRCAPALGAAALLLPFPGKAAAAAPSLCVGLGLLLLPRFRPPFPGKKRPILHRLFFSAEAGSAAWALSFSCTQHVSPSRAAHGLLSFGNILISLILCEKALMLPLPPKGGWIGGTALFALWLLLIVCT